MVSENHTMIQSEEHPILSFMLKKIILSGIVEVMYGISPVTITQVRKNSVFASSFYLKPSLEIIFKFSKL